MSQYRVFIKDALDIAGLPTVNTICTGFSIERDLLSSASSTFTLLDTPGNVKEGDVLGLADPYGTVVYNGVIKSISDNEIMCTQLLSIFDDDWKWHDPSATTIEGKIKSIIEDDFINSTDELLKKKFPFTVTTTSSTTGTFIQHTETQDDVEVVSQNYVENLEEFFYSLYDQWGVIVDVVVPFRGDPTITIGTASTLHVKIGNNALPITQMTPFSEIFEINKLLIYNDEGSTLRGTYYGTLDGITTDSSDPLRLPVINTEYVFDSEGALSDIVNERLQEQMVNHKVEFSMLLDNNLWDFYSWQLGQPFDIWYNTEYFSTVYTGYSIAKEPGRNPSAVDIVCGKVRNKLTQIWNARLA